MSQAGLINVSASVLPPTVATSFTGNDGVQEHPSGNNFNLLTANSTVKFAGSAATETLDFGLTNLLLGSSGPALTSGSSNTSLGWLNLSHVTSGQYNTAVGTGALQFASSGTDNTAIGASAGVVLGTGSHNTLIGSRIAGGYNTSESSNILVGNNGQPGDNNKLRIGTQGSGAGQQNQTFIAGITGATPTSANTPQVVLCDNTGNLAPISSGTAGFVLTSNGSATPSFQAAGGGGSTVYFSAYLTATQSNVTGDGTLFTPIYDGVLSNSGDYNPATGVFTAPSTGTYLFSYITAYTNASVATAFINAFASGAPENYSFRADQCTGLNVVSGTLISSGTTILHLSAGTTMQMIAAAYGTTKSVGIQGGSLGSYGIAAMFSGFKIA